MAGMDDYRFFAEMRRDSPFWERKQNEEIVPESVKGPYSFHQYDSSDVDSEYTTEKYIGLGAGLIGRVTEYIFSHPFVVLRRQCQVHVKSRRYHVVCVTLLPAVLNLHRRQGLTTLWKGIGSVLIMQGLTLGVEDFISKLTMWPKEISRHNSLKMIGRHLALKCVSIALMTPFFSASLVETVQSDIASEKPKLLDVFKEGMCRMLSWSAPHTGRMLPVWILVIPTVCHGILKYILSTLVKGVTLQVFRSTQKEEQRRQGAVSRDPLGCSNAHYSEFTAAVTGHLVAEVILFPLETVLHRLHLQGTRTIIDNLDSGREVVPVITGYEGVVDCFRTTVAEEGVLGLFKGLGALTMQYALPIAVLKLTRHVVRKLAHLVHPLDIRHAHPETYVPEQQKPQSTGSPARHGAAAAGHSTQAEGTPVTQHPQPSNRSEVDATSRASSLYMPPTQRPHDIYLPRYNY